MVAYEVVLQTQTWNALAATKGAERKRLLVILENLAATPFRAGDFQQRDQTGRTNEVALIGDWLVTFWSDHAAREIRVTALERADDGP